MHTSTFFSFIAGVVDTADKLSIAKISANLRKKSKRSKWDMVLRAQGKPIYEINLKLKISCQTPFKLVIHAYGKKKSRKKSADVFCTCSPVEREMKDTDMNAVPGPEESHSATNGREELKIKTINLYLKVWWQHATLFGFILVCSSTQYRGWYHNGTHVDNC